MAKSTYRALRSRMLLMVVSAAAMMIAASAFCVATASAEYRSYFSWSTGFLGPSPSGGGIDFASGNLYVSGRGLSLFSVAHFGPRGTERSHFASFPGSDFTRDLAANSVNGDVFLSTAFDEIWRFEGYSTLPTSSVVSEAASLDIGPNGRLYVLAPTAHEVRLYTRDGSPIGSHSSTETGGDPSQQTPVGIALGGGITWVSDSEQDEIRGFRTRDGVYVRTIGSGGTGQLIDAGQIDADESGRIYALDRGDNSVKIYEADGTLLEAVPTGLGDPVDVTADDGGNFWVFDRFNQVQAFASAPRLIGGLSRDFGSAYLGDAPADQLIYMQNENSLHPLPLGSASLDVGAHFSLVPGTQECDSVSLSPGRVCAIGVRFDPQSVGPHSDTLNLDGGRLKVTLTGTGREAPVGPPGDTGAAGRSGDTGPAGPEGPRGETGPSGATGPAGRTGTKGSRARVGKLRSGPVRLRAGRRTNLVAFRCLEAACAVQGRRVTIRIRGKAWRVRLIGPKRVAPGKIARFGIVPRKGIVARLKRNRRSGVVNIYLATGTEAGGRTLRNLRIAVMR